MPTLGFDLEEVMWGVDDQRFRVKLYGLGGAKRIRGYWRNYYDEVGGGWCQFRCTLSVQRS